MKAFDSTPSTRPDRALQIALFLTSAVWFFAAQQLAGRAATGLSIRFNLSDERSLLVSLDHVKRIQFVKFILLALV